MSAHRLQELWERYLSYWITVAERREFQVLGQDSAYNLVLDALVSEALEGDRFIVEELTMDKEMVFREVMRRVEEREGLGILRGRGGLRAVLRLGGEGCGW